MTTEAKTSQLTTRVTPKTKKRVRTLQRVNGGMKEATLVNILLNWALAAAEKGQITLAGAPAEK